MNDAEFKALRDEIIEHLRISHQYLAGTITVTAALFALYAKDIGGGQAFSSPYILLLPLVFILPNAFDYASRSEGIVRIASYIEVFGGESFRWECHLHCLEESWKEGITFYGQAARLMYTIPRVGLGILCVVLFLLASPESMSIYVKMVISVSCGIVLVFAQVRILRTWKLRAKYISHWKAIKSLEDKQRVKCA